MLILAALFAVAIAIFGALLLAIGKALADPPKREMPPEILQALIEAVAAQRQTNEALAQFAAYQHELAYLRSRVQVLEQLVLSHREA